MDFPGAGIYGGVGGDLVVGGDVGAERLQRGRKHGVVECAEGAQGDRNSFHSVVRGVSVNRMAFTGLETMEGLSRKLRG